jgi:hypothetical protein
MDGAVSDVKEITTESEVQVTNGDMESWSKSSFGNAYYNENPLYLYTCSGWSTRNTKTTDGASNSNVTSKSRVFYKWFSGTMPTSSTKDGSSNAAELTTLALYNDDVYYLSSNWRSRDKVKSNVKSNHTVYSAILFLGDYNLSSDSYTLGISHEARPSKLQFDYKYVAISGDNFIATAAVYDSDGNVIGKIDDISGDESAWNTKSVEFKYSNTFKKVAKISVFFQSGTVSDFDKFNQIQGGRDSYPYSEDKFTGSVLSIDNVKLIYE